ncbi:hypothetical protein SeLEV6574_g01012 [Synchytrium endobioticum]|uniref:Vacuolar fusion protein MON1 n=1 Tax=Synchytrium endobioticum TaxID=286115 RepID=A0A507DF96_9FUNG|nr:hypothetical protein SeLEV6574_g01012 [Synchytrium endobioticum]
MTSYHPSTIDIAPFSPTDFQDVQDDTLLPHQSASSAASSSRQGAGVVPYGAVSSLSSSFISKFGSLASRTSADKNTHHNATDILGGLDVSVDAIKRPSSENHLHDEDDSMPFRSHNTNLHPGVNTNSSDTLTAINTPLVAAQGDFVDAAARLHIDDRASIRSGFQRKNGNDGPNTEQWVSRRKHFFVLSSAGKPIYTRYGDESKLSSYMGVIQAILSFFASDDDTLRCINAGSHKFVFASRGPLYLVAISATGESENQLREQLQYLYNQILFILTAAQLTRIFEQRVNYDLRNLLAGTENLLDELCNSFSKTASHYLSAINPLRMSHRLRNRIGVIMSNGIPKSLAFGLIIAKERLVTLVRPKAHSLHPSDLLLLINLLSASPGMKSAESWTPICLPRFNARNHMHVYVCYVARDVAMVLVGPERDAFYDFSEYKAKAVKDMGDQGCFEGLEEAVKMDPYSLNEVGVPIIRHFIFKSRALVQYTQPAPSPPYTNKQDWKRLLLLYQHAHSKLYKRPHASKVVFNVGAAESVLAVATSTHELYISFGPLITKTAAVAAANGLQKWVQRWEQGLFLTKAPSF